MQLDAYLNAHAFMLVERPPDLWEVDTEEVAFLRMLGEMIAVGLGRRSELEDLVLNVANVSIGAEAADGDFHAGEYVAVTVRGTGDWGPEERWSAGGPRPRGWIRCIDQAALAAGAALAYTRSLGDGGSLTVFLPRLGPSA